MPIKRRRLPRNPYINTPFPWLRVFVLGCIGIVLAWVGLALILHSKATTSTTATNPSSNEMVLNNEPQKIAEPQTRIGIQVGHWKMDELPSEFSETSRWNTGGSVSGVDEWASSLDIANKLQEILGRSGYLVDIIPATIPVDYQADAFISLHADGNEVTSVSGFKVAANSWDETGKAEILSSKIEAAYKAATGMITDPNITEDMTEYYAFNRIKYNHSIAETTPGVILEYGFLTNYSDRLYIVNHSDKIAQAIADGIEDYLKTK